MDHFPQLAPLSPLRISSSSGAPSSSSPNHPYYIYPRRPSPTSFPGPTGIGASPHMVDFRYINKPLFPDSERDDLITKTQQQQGATAAVYNIDASSSNIDNAGYYTDQYFGSEMMNRRRAPPMHHDPRPSTTSSRFSENTQFTASPHDRYYRDDRAGDHQHHQPGRRLHQQQRDFDPSGEYEPQQRRQQQYAERMPPSSPAPMNSYYYDDVGRRLESSSQHTPNAVASANRRYYEEPEPLYRRDAREENDVPPRAAAATRVPQHHLLPHDYELPEPYHRPPPPPPPPSSFEDRWSGDGIRPTSSSSLRRPSPHDYNNDTNFAPYDDDATATIPSTRYTTTRRDSSSEYNRYTSSNNNPRRTTTTPPEYDHNSSDYLPERTTTRRPLSPPSGRASSPAGPTPLRSKSRERGRHSNSRSDSDPDEFRAHQSQRKAPVREHFFPHHKRRLKGYYRGKQQESDDPSSSSNSSSSSSSSASSSSTASAADVQVIRRSRSNSRRSSRNAISTIPEEPPVFEAVSYSESSDSGDGRHRRRRSNSKSRENESPRVVVSSKKSPRRQTLSSSSESKSKTSRNQQHQQQQYYEIDLSNATPSKRHVTFSPSTEMEQDNNSIDGEGSMNGGGLYNNTAAVGYGKQKRGDDNNNNIMYAQRMANAALLKEQSEARNQILQEIRQAMEMRDLSNDESDQEFWQRQISTLNASLRKLTVSLEYDNDNNINNNTNGRSKTNGSSLRYEGRDDDGPTSSHRQQRHDTATATSISSSSVDQRNAEAMSASHQSSTIVKVRAPDDLAGGHKFTVRINGKKLVARVPQGGVFKGDIFSIRIPNESLRQVPTSVVKVRAPASMPEGYQFTAKMDNQTIVATVPPGGVNKGDIFTVPVVEYL